MTETDVEALTRRLDRLERRLRRWRIVGGVAWTAVAASVALIYVLVFREIPEGDTADDSDSDAEAVVEDEVRAKAFVLVDEDGQPRAALAMRPDGTPALAFTNEDGQITWKAP